MTTWKVKCGIATYSSHLIKHLKETPIILAAKDEDSIGGLEAGEFRCWDKNSSDFSEFFDLIKQNKITKLMIQHHPGQIVFSDLNGLLIKLHELGVETSVTLHNTRERPLIYRKNRIDRAIPSLINCTNVIVHSNHDMNRLSKMGISENTHIIPHGIYAKPEDLVPLSLPEGRKIATFGFLLPNKGFRELIVAFSKIKGTRWDKLVMLCANRGDSDRELLACNSLISKLDLGNDVILNSEFLDDDVAISTLAECDLVVFPYQKTKESASGAARMAIAAGVPIAVTPLEIFSDLEGAIELPGIASEDISRGLSHISDEDLELSRDYIEKFSDMYQWRKVSGMYQELIGGDSNE
tara:strand:+ start:2415 stop:3470 length:1056 start_codon:yes stop_codon:yes gene_type:complete